MHLPALLLWGRLRLAFSLIWTNSTQAEGLIYGGAKAIKVPDSNPPGSFSSGSWKTINASGIVACCLRLQTEVFIDK